MNNIENLIEKYIENRKVILKENTINNIKLNLNRYLSLYFKDSSISNINDLNCEDINKYYIYIASLPIKNQSINLIIGHILGFIGWLDLMEYINPNILRKFRKIFIKKEMIGSHKNDYLQNDEIDKLLSAFNQDNEKDWYKRFVILSFIYTGLRKGELYALTWKDININLSYYYYVSATIVTSFIKRSVN